MDKSVFIVLTGLSGLTRMITYILIILKSFGDKRCGMPLFALAFNLCWELVYSFLLGGDWNLQRTINAVWLLFDIIILITYFKYERKHFESEYGTGFVPWTVIVFSSAFIIMIAAKAEFTGYLGAQYTAFAQNVMMSVLFIQMLKKRKSAAAQSQGIAITKMIGTLAPTLLVFLAKGSALLQTLGLVILVFDLIYIHLLRNVLKLKTLPVS